MIRLTALLCVATFSAAPAAIFAGEAKVETIAEGLASPAGVAIQPETGTVFVAEGGAGRVVRIVDNKATEVITGFAKEAKALAGQFDVGPLGLAFIDKETIAVGEGGLAAGEDRLLVFKLTADLKPVTADQAKFALKLPAAEKATAEGNFYGVAVTKAGIYCTSAGDSTPGCVNRADINGTKVENFRRLMIAQKIPNLAPPLGITISPRGEVVVGHSGKAGESGDSLLAFYSAKDGKLLASFPTSVNDITGLAYSPAGQLYALDAAWGDASQGGLYQLIAVRDGSGTSLKAQKIVSLQQPSAMAFSNDGVLYITLMGGKLVKIALP